MTPKEKVEEWSKALWKRGVIDNFKNSIKRLGLKLDIILL